MLSLSLSWYSYTLRLWKCVKFSLWVAYKRHSDIQAFLQNSVNSGGMPKHLFLQPPFVIPTAMKVEDHCTGTRLSGHSISIWVTIQPVLSFSLPITLLRDDDKHDKFLENMYNRNTERGEHFDNAKIPSYLHTLWWADCGKVALPHVK